MANQTEVMDLNERDREVLSVLAVRTSNPYHIREETGLDKGDVNTVLNKLARYGYIRQVTRGLYEITEKGEQEADDDE